VILDKNNYIKMDKHPDLYKLILYKYNDFIKCNYNNYIKKYTYEYDKNQPLKKGVIPHNVNCLKFKDWYNKPLQKNIIPHNITHIEFGSNFNKPLKKKDIPV